MWFVQKRPRVSLEYHRHDIGVHDDRAHGSGALAVALSRRSDCKILQPVIQVLIIVNRVAIKVLTRANRFDPLLPREVFHASAGVGRNAVFLHPVTAPRFILSTARAPYGAAFQTRLAA